MTSLKRNFQKGFTLIELIITLAILGLLSVILLLILNPAEVAKQGHDAARLADLTSINKALNVYQVEVSFGSFGTSTIVYTSLLDATATSSAGTTCSSMNLPTLPSGYTYHCSSVANGRRIDGTGWIPVNLTSIPSGPPISAWAVDPVNSTSSRTYYTYSVVGNSWHLAGPLEALKYKMGGDKDAVSVDGGLYPDLFEKGVTLNLIPIDYADTNLSLFLRFDENGGSSAGDASGNGLVGTLVNNPTWSTGKVGSAVTFNGVNSYVSVPDNAVLDPTAVTVTAWVKFNSIPYTGQIAINKEGQYRLIAGDVDTSHASLRYATTATGWGSGTLVGSTALAAGRWYHVAATYDGAAWKLYLNGIQDGSKSESGNLVSGSNPLYIGTQSIGSNPFNGSVDDVHVYRRALSPQEVAAIYNATK